MKKLVLFFIIFFVFGGQVFALEGLWYYTETPRARESLFKNISKINILAPQVYELGMNGEVKGTLSNDVLDLAKKYNVKVMPLLANTSGKFFDQKTILDLLHHKDSWQKVADFLQKEGITNSYYGFQLDLENIPVDEKENFNNFVKFLKSEFEKTSNPYILKLSVAIVAKISNNEKDYKNVFVKNYWKNWAGVYDYKILSHNVDFLSIMAYDQPDSHGPVATINWSKKVLDYTLKNVEPTKISFGIPVYGWVYKGNAKKHFRMIDFPFTNSKLLDFKKSDSKNMTTGAGMSKVFGNISWVSYNQQGQNYTIWYEDKNSFQTKLNQIKKAGVQGFSVWVLGDEDPSIWEII